MRKTNFAFAFTFLMILASAMMVSADLSKVNYDSTIEFGESSFSFELNDTNGPNTYFGEIVSGSANISISGTTVTVTDIASGFDSISGKVNASDGNETTFNVEVVYVFCSNDKQGSNFWISDFDVNNKGRGDDGTWNYFDEITIEVEVENTHNDDDVKDVYVDVVVFDSDGNDVTDDFDLNDDSIKLGRIKSDDNTETAEFKISKLKIDENLGQGTYRAYFKAYSKDLGEDNKCVQDADWDGEEYFEFEIEEDDLDDHLLVDDSNEFSASCGEDNVIVRFDVWNLEDKEDSVLVNLYSSSLGVDEYVVIDGLREMKNEEVTFSFDMPDYAANNYYNLDVYLFFDYDDEDGDEFDEQAYTESDDFFQIKLNIASCAAPEPTVAVTSNDEIQEGEEFSFEVSVTNNAPDTQNVIVSIEGADSWAEDISVSQGVLTLDGDKTDTVTVTLTPTEDGSHTLSVKTTIGVDSYTQPVNVSVESRWSIGKYFSSEYWAYWAAIGLVVLILIVLISIIAVMRR